MQKKNIPSSLLNEGNNQRWLKGLLTSLCLLIWMLTAGLGLASNAKEHQQRDSKKIAKVLLEVGKKFEQRGIFDAAAVEYQKVLEYVPAHLEAHDRLIKLYTTYKSLSSDEIKDYFFEIDKFERHYFLDLLYQTYAIEPARKKNVDWLITEAFLLRDSVWSLNGSHDQKYFQGAEAVLQQAHQLAPNNSTVLYQLGKYRSFLTKHTEGKVEGMDLLRKAIQLKPTSIKPRQALAEALTWNGQGAEGIRTYREAIHVIKGNTPDSGSTQYNLALAALEIFVKYAREDKVKHILTPKLQMPLSERANSIQDLLTNEKYGYEPFFKKQVFTNSGSSREGPRALLAQLYLELGEFEKADATLENSKNFNDRHWSEKKLYNLWIQALQKGGHNPQKLKKVQAEFDEKFKKKDPGPRKKRRE